jgi:hypothetical protein
MVRKHLERLFPDHRERELLTSWLAQNVRYPGTKIRWAPYIHGAQGTGKTFIAELLSMVMGAPNVQTLSGRLLRSDFNAWTIGAAVTVIEEVYQTGHIFETEETLKAPISNDTISVHCKGRDAYQAPNYTNYLLLSNHPDGMPVSEGDRRFFFLRVSMTAGQAKSLSQEGYFNNLFDACRDNVPGLRRWLESEVQMHPEFDRQGRAPETLARSQVIEMSKGDAEAAIEDAVGEALAITSAWVKGILASQDIEPPKTHGMGKLLARLGFEFHARPRIGGKKSRVYVRHGWLPADEKALVEELAKLGPAEFAEMDD